MDRLKEVWAWLSDKFDALPPKVKVFLVGLYWAALPPALDAAADAIEPLITGAEPVNRVALSKVLVVSLLAGYAAGKNYVKESPMPRRAWTYAERKAEWARQAREGKSQ